MDKNTFTPKGKKVFEKDETNISVLIITWLLLITFDVIYKMEKELGNYKVRQTSSAYLVAYQYWIIP